MCGRFVRMASAHDIVHAYGATDRGERISPSYNVAPSHPILAIRNEDSERSAFVPRWGFQARWKGPSSLVINARIEGVHERPLFRNLVQSHRCVIPLSGYYEWVTNDQTLDSLGRPRKKVPFYISSGAVQAGEALTLSAAGLWRREEDTQSAVMLTTAAVPSLSRIHDRMPVLLSVEQVDMWLGDESAIDWEALSRQRDSELVATRVRSDVNSTRNNSPNLLTPFDGDEQERLF